MRNYKQQVRVYFKYPLNSPPVVAYVQSNCQAFRLFIMNVHVTYLLVC